MQLVASATISCYDKRRTHKAGTLEKAVHIVDVEEKPTARALFVSFLRLGATAFGGPAMIAQIRDLVVTRHDWLTDTDFAEGVALCQALPGATAMQCAAYVGWRLQRLRGALACYLGFGLPAFALMLCLSMLYQRAQGVAAFSSLLTGLSIMAASLVAHALWTFGKASIRGAKDAAVVATVVLALFLGASPPLVIATAVVLSVALVRRNPGSQSAKTNYLPTATRDLVTTAFLALVGAAIVTATFAYNETLGTLELVMMKVDLFAFGGAFASLPLMLHEVVQTHHWMDARTFTDGITLGQITPGPIVITATFVGFQVAGLLGALAATIGVFLPSIVLVVLAAPWFHRLQAFPLFRPAVHGATLSLVGLLLSLAVQISHTIHWTVPAIGVAVTVFVALLLKANMLWVVPAGAVVSALLI